MDSNVTNTNSSGIGASNDIKSLLARARQIAVAGPRSEARILFGLDATQSREETIGRARRATSEMFSNIRCLGSLSIRLAFYRGLNECKATAWLDNIERITDLMEKINCKAGTTQIDRLLTLASESGREPKPDAAIFIGDHLEEDAEVLIAKAAQLGSMRIPLIIFHEVNDGDDRALQASSTFMKMARASGGHYCVFNNRSASVLRELLETLIAFKMRGAAGLEALMAPKTPEAKKLAVSLLQIPPPR